MIDTHCHLDAARFDADRAEVLSRAFGKGLTAIVLPGIGPSNWDTLLEMARAEPRLWVGLGMHPQFLPDLPQDGDGARLELLDAMLSQRSAVAVGECGLDGPSLERAPLERQLKVLRGHFGLARKHGLPLLLHCFHAHPALLELFKDEPFPEAGVVLHSYSGGPELVRAYASLGCYFSFAGPVSYVGARKPVAALKQVPPERLLVETDAPDQAPHPFRGQRSEPAYVVEILAAMAAALSEPVDVLAERTSLNARRLFRRS